MVTLLLLTALAADAGTPCLADAVMEAAVVRALDVETAAIHMETAVCSVPAGTVVDAAVVEPGARFGRSVRFRLLQGDKPVGYAISTAKGTVKHVRTTRALAASALVTPADVEEVDSDLGNELLQPLPRLDEVVGRALVRPLTTGAVVNATAVRVPPAVRSGDRVVVRSVFGGVEARTTATAQQSGRIGDVIRLVNADSKRALRGRIVGPGEVEVIHGS